MGGDRPISRRWFSLSSNGDIVLHEYCASPFAQSTQLRLLQKGHALWGILEKVKPIGGGLLHVRVGDIDRLLPEELAPKLWPLIGKCVSIVRDGDRYGMGELPTASVEGRRC